MVKKINRSEILTRRLLLREPGLKDAPVIAELAGVFEIADTTLRIPHPYRLSDAESWIRDVRRQARAGKAMQWVIVLKNEPALIGSVGLMGIDPEHRHGELGYWIGKPWWKNGFATEAGKAVVKYAFEKLRLHRVHAHHFKRNAGSEKVLQKIGMTHEGTLQEHVIRWGCYEDLEMYGMLNPSEVKRSPGLNKK